MVTVLLVSLAFAFGAAFWLIRTAREHPETYAEHLPQRFHVGHVPRLGGVAMFAGCSAGWLWMMLSEPLGLPGLFRLEPWRGGVLWALAALVLAGGVYEDLTQRFSPRWRLLMTLAAGIAAWVVLDVCVPRIDLPVVDAWWGAVAWPGVLLAILAIAGLPHAFNLIDGYNGLAAIVAPSARRWASCSCSGCSMTSPAASSASARMATPSSAPWSRCWWSRPPGSPVTGSPAALPS